jgi:hypothetical protein
MECVRRVFRKSKDLQWKRNKKLSIVLGNEGIEYPISLKATTSLRVKMRVKISIKGGIK